MIGGVVKNALFFQALETAYHLNPSPLLNCVTSCRTGRTQEDGTGSEEDGTGPKERDKQYWMLTGEDMFETGEQYIFGRRGRDVKSWARERTTRKQIEHNDGRTNTISTLYRSTTQVRGGHNTNVHIIISLATWN